MNTNLHIKRSTSRTGRQGGSSLLEVLVALLVLSIGLLGLAALQTTGLKFNQQSYQRTQGTLLAYEILDRIRSNPVGIANYDNVTLASGPPGHSNCLSTLCTAAQIAVYDIFQWKISLRDLLAQGNGTICRGTLTIDTTAFPATAVCALTGTIYRVGIVWTENDIAKEAIVEAQI